MANLVWAEDPQSMVTCPAGSLLTWRAKDTVGLALVRGPGHPVVTNNLSSSVVSRMSYPLSLIGFINVNARIARWALT